MEMTKFGAWDLSNYLTCGWEITDECWECHGKGILEKKKNGKYIEKICPVCGGEGKITIYK